MEEAHILKFMGHSKSNFKRKFRAINYLKTKKVFKQPNIICQEIRKIRT